MAAAPPAPAAPPTWQPTPEQIRAAQEQAAQYAAQQGAPWSQETQSLLASLPPSQPPPQEPRPPSMAPGLGTVGGAPITAPKEVAPPKPPGNWPDKPVEAKTPPGNWPDKPVEAKAPPENWPDKPVAVPSPRPQAEQLPQAQPQQPPPQVGPIPLEQEDSQTQVPKTTQPAQPQDPDSIAFGQMTPREVALAKEYQSSLTDLSKPAVQPSAEMMAAQNKFAKLRATAVNAPESQPTEQPKTENIPTATVPADQPPATRSVQENTKLSGLSTIFGLNYDGSIDRQDNGVGFFGGINTRDPSVKGVAVPIDVLEKTFGTFTKLNSKGGYDLLDTPEAHKIYDVIRSSHVEVSDSQGVIHKFPIVDIQASLRFHPNRVLDLTYGAAKELGFKDNTNVSYSLVGGDGKTFDLSGLGGGKPGGKRREGQDTLVPMVPSEGGAPAPAPVQTPVSQGSGARAGIGEIPESPASQGGGWFGGFGFPLFGRGGGGGASPAAQQAPEPEAPSSLMAQLVSRGFTPDEALRYAQGLATTAPASGMGPLQIQGPAAAPGAKQPAALPAPPAAPSAPSLLQTKQPEPVPRKVPPIVPPKQGALSDADQKTVVQTLTGLGINKGHAQALVQNASGGSVDEVLANALKLHGQGAIRGVGTATFRPPAPPAPPGAPPAKPPPGPAPQQPAQPKQPVIREPSEFGRPKGSTIGVPNPSGAQKLTKEEHAASLSPDDPRVKRQKDGTIKGEHFVEGDPFHDQLLGGLPEGKEGPQRRSLAEAEAAIAEKRPMHISYLSAPKEAQKFPTRESRTVQYEEHSPEARLMGTTTGQLVGHSFIPVAVGVSPAKKKDEPHQSYIQGISTNVLANNFWHLNTKLAAMGRKSPYEALGPKFFNDVRGYFANLNAGHIGTGRGYAAGTEDLPNEPDREHVPYKLSRKEADFINTVINNTMAFSKHEDADKLRELARANGTLITPEGETNRMRHEIEQDEPGWRKRVLEPSIRSFKTGLIVAHHRSEEHFPETIRPGKEYQGLTRAIQATSEHGRPDVPIAVSLHHNLGTYRDINKIEREFSEGKIDEAQAHEALKAMGEDPGDYRFIKGSGGLITPYEDDPEAITPEEHKQMRENLRTQWVGGKLDTEKYRQKSAEIPLPTKPSEPTHHFAEGGLVEPDDESATLKGANSPQEAARARLEKEGVGQYQRSGEQTGPHDPKLASYLEALAGSSDTLSSKALDDHHKRWGNIVAVKGEEARRLATHAQSRGELLEPMARPADTGGGEHLVWLDPERVTKETEPTHGYGYVSASHPPTSYEMRGATPYEYLKRIALAREHFGQDTRLEGIVKQGGSLRIRTSEPRIGQSKSPSQEEADNYMFDHGFKPDPRWQDTWHHPSGTVAIDAHEKNFVYDDEGKVKPVDVILRRDRHTGAGAGSAQHFAQGGEVEPEKVKRAAVRFHGKVYEGAWHGEANEHAAKAHDDDPETIMHSRHYESGFTTNKGRFISPEEAWELAGYGKEGYLRSEQIPPEHFAQGGLVEPDDEGNDTDPLTGQSIPEPPEAPSVPQEAPGPAAGVQPPAPQPKRAKGPPAAQPQAPTGPAPIAQKPKQAPAKLSKATLKRIGPRPEDETQGAIHDRVAARLDSEIPGAIKLDPDRKENGDFKLDSQGNPLYKKNAYDIANAPMLKKQGKELGMTANPKTGKMAMSKAPEDTEDTLEKSDLKYLNPTDRLRVAHLQNSSAVDAYADKLHDFHESVKHDSDVQDALKWYDEAEELIGKHFGGHSDLVANLLAATSAGNAVKINYGMAMEGYHEFLRGKYDKAIELYRQAHEIRKSGKNALMQHITDNKIHEALGEDAPKTDAAAMDQWIAHHGIEPRMSNGKKFGHNSAAVLKVLAHNWLEQAGGPKTPNFAGNLSGRSLQATIDMWSARTLRRLGYEGHTKEPWLIQPAAETGVHDVDFALGQLAFRKAAQKMGVTPRALQSALWFAEQKHWQKNGWEREIDPADRDYRPMLRRYQRPTDLSPEAYEKAHPSVAEVRARAAPAAPG